jgi:hypothetical protein
MSTQPETLIPEDDTKETKESSALRVIGWLSLGVAVAAVGVFVGRELTKRYKFNHQTPYDFYSEAGKRQNAEFGLGI